MKTSSGGEHVDKYEQLLSKYDWHNPRPPHGYQYGVGRGAKAFTTSGELASGLSLSTLGKPTTEELDFFSALDRLEERRPARKKLATDNKNGEGDAGGSSSAPAQGKLSMEDLAAFSGLGVTAAGGGSTAATTTIAPLSSSPATMAGTQPGAPAADPASRAGAAATAAPAATSAYGLTVRNARHEAVDNAEEHLFSDERGLTMHDILRGKNTATQHHLQNILEMGSPDEQATWITHARALREMGMARKAAQTLAEGCARTGARGPLIWEERLRCLPPHDAAARRRVLEEATTACPGEERLWLQLIPCQPVHERVEWLQRAVIACPRSERLWLRVVALVPSTRDQKRMIAQALQRTPALPLLWAKLARLEASAVTGKQIFAAAAARYPSLPLVLEAAKYAEWVSYQGRRTTGAPAGGGGAGGGDREEGRRARDTAAMLRDVRATVQAACVQYLDPSDGASRRRWIDAAQALVSDAGASLPEAGVVGPGTGVAVLHRYVWTAAYVLLFFVRPVSRSGGDGGGTAGLTAAVQATWLEDLVAGMDEAMSHHGVLCALWATWLLLLREGLLPVSVTGGDSPGGAVSEWVMEVLQRAVATAPLPALTAAVDAMLASHRMPATTSKPLDGERCAVKAEGHDRAGHPPQPEDEEEELGPARPPVRLHPSPVSATHVVSVKPEVKVEPEGEDEELAGGGGSDSRRGPSARALDRGTASQEEEAMPFPIEVVLQETISLFSPTAASVGSPQRSGGDGGGGVAVLHSVQLSLVLAKSLFTRGQYVAAVLVLQLARASRRGGDGGGLDDSRIVAAIAKCYAALGSNQEADACLAEALAARASATATISPSEPSGDELLYVKLAVHRRSGRGAPCDLEAFLAEATSRCPRSARLWLMRLEAVRSRIALPATASVPSLAAAAEVMGSTARPPAAAAAAAAISPAHMRELRTLYAQALSPAHCRTSTAVWVYVAVRVEAELFNAAATARALLLDAAVACGVVMSTSGATPTPSTATAASLVDGRVLGHHAAAQLGEARARVELLHAGPAQAFEVVQETLQRLPKTRDGAFTIPVGPLLQLFIDLQVPAARGRAAAQVVRQWRSREPLALLAVAKVYHAGGQYAKALEQAVRAATGKAEGSGGNGCGDAAALLLRMTSLPEYRTAIGARLAGARAAGAAPVGSATAAEAAASESEARRWLLRLLHGDGGSASVAPEEELSFELLHFNSGPLWIQVAKAEDPTNVTLLGYRDSVESMLGRVAALMGI